jgi:hypothetical protein
MQVRYKFFRGNWATWDALFSKAAKYATKIGSERILNISHSVSGTDGTVTVWYLAEEGDDAAGE